MFTLIKFSTFVHQITANNSRIHKQTILHRYKDDENIKFYLHYIFNPYITTGLSTKKLNKQVTGFDAVSPFLSIKELLNYISANNTGTDEIIARINKTKEKTLGGYEGLVMLLDDIISKSITLGVDAKTINKEIPNLIPQFSVQLAEKYFENPEKIRGKRFAITTKIDGGRIVAFKKNGVVEFFTRQGQKYEGLVDLEREMAEKIPENTCFDGELTLLHPNGLSSKEQYKQTMKISRADGEKHGLKMKIFDRMTVDEFRNQSCPDIWSERRRKLEHDMSGEFAYFELLPILYEGDDINQIKTWLDYNVSHGEEGIMLNICDAVYDFKRTWSLQKVKLMQDVDLEIIGFEEGSQRLKGTLGAILVDYKGNIVKCGSGFSDELREEIWEHRDTWLGRTAVIQYFEETNNAKDGISLRFPVFLDYRTDK